MELIASLQMSFARPGAAPQAPRNLLQLASLLGQHQAGPEVAHYSLLWAEELTRIRDSDHQALARKRGTLRRLWAQQSLVYQDLIATLEQAADRILDRQFGELKHTSSQFNSLLEEFAESLQEMDDWSRSDHPRCLSCSWDGDAESCPHCRLQLLAPVRETRAQAAPLSLAPHHQSVFDTVSAILQGASDLSSLQLPLQGLHSDFHQAVVDARASSQSYPEMEVVADILEVALDGLTEMSLVFEDCDSQHLEDGWNAFYLSQLTLVDALSQSDSDQVTFSRD